MRYANRSFMFRPDLESAWLIITKGSEKKVQLLISGNRGGVSSIFSRVISVLVSGNGVHSIYEISKGLFLSQGCSQRVPSRSQLFGILGCTLAKFCLWYGIQNLFPICIHKKILFDKIPIPTTNSSFPSNLLNSECICLDLLFFKKYEKCGPVARRRAEGQCCPKQSRPPPRKIFK